MRLPRPAAAALLAAAVLARAAPSAAQAAPGPSSVLQAAADRAGRIFQAPQKLRPGDALLAWAAFALPPASVTASVVDGRGKVLAAARTFAAGALITPIGTYERRLFGILAPIPKDAAGGGYTLVVRASNEGAAKGSPGWERFEMRRSFALERRDFARESISLNQANSDLRSAEDPMKVEEAKRLYAILSRSDPSALFLDGREFALPVEGSVQTSAFGDERTYVYANGETALSVHAGLDLAVPTGTPVLACAGGRVAFAAERIVTGLTVVLEHLPGLFSEYMHLSAIEVREGDLVEREMRIGAAGSSGLSTGPHLHWELRAAGLAVDPQPWLSSPPLDKELAVDIMNALIEGR